MAFFDFFAFLVVFCLFGFICGKAEENKINHRVPKN